MKARIFTSLVAFTLLLGAAPAPAPAPAAPAITGFKHDPKIDVFGYYIPEPEFKIGKWQLTSINIGLPQDFIDYEKGKRDPPEYAPINLEFADTTSPMVENELGGSNPSIQRRVLPTAYLLVGNRLAFVGKDAVLGPIVFNGTLDVAAVKRATAAAGQSTDTSIVLTGDLTVGTRVIRNVKFTWFGGD